MSSGGFTALDILDVLPYDRMIDVEIGRILGQAGALRARGLAKRDTYQYSAHDDTRKWFKKKRFKKTDANTIIPLIGSHMAVLLMATLVAIVAYQAAYHTLNGILNGGYFHSTTLDGTLQLKKQESVITQSFILLNSIGFVGSLAAVMSLLREFPFKPWSQISGVLKLNVDEAAKGTQVFSGGGVVVRNQEGIFVLAGDCFYGEGLNMRGEGMALLDGLRMYRSFGLEGYKLLIESDSQILVQMVLGRIEIPWSLSVGGGLKVHSFALRWCTEVKECRDGRRGGSQLAGSVRTRVGEKRDDGGGW
ncbi:unnamed protein product [Ilex paraguariensis]|uniref:RNase H type-1 domain-containing protein n=1 Tax=Ilex paraguariensis TaxID=185542 RepID=A0ABC8V4A0_9AQUA